MKTIAQTFIEQGRIQARHSMQEEIQKLRQEDLIKRERPLWTLFYLSWSNPLI